MFGNLRQPNSEDMKELRLGPKTPETCYGCGQSTEGIPAFWADGLDRSSDKYCELCGLELPKEEEILEDGGELEEIEQAIAFFIEKEENAESEEARYFWTTMKVKALETREELMGPGN
jgi:DNA repair exonuclease SbcCD ATPase subunit